MGDVAFLVWLAMGAVIIAWGVIRRIKKKKNT